MLKRHVDSCLRVEKNGIHANTNRHQYDEAYWNNRIKIINCADVTIVPQVIFILSNRCTLRCDGCSMLMPKFETEWELNADEAIKCIDNFLRGIDECISFNLIGGEPFLYDKLHIIIDHLQENDKVKIISMSTNCTVIPSEMNLQAFRNSKVEIHLSDYADIVTMAKLIKCFEINGICFDVISNRQWIEFGDTQKRNKTAQGLREEYRRCFVSATCKAIYKNMFFACERAARMYMLGNIYDAAHDFIILNEQDDDKTINANVREMLFRDIALACDYCDAGQYPPKIIPAGKQIGQDRFRSSYTFALREGL